MYKLSSTEREKNNNIEALAVCPIKNGLLLIFMQRGIKWFHRNYYCDKLQILCLRIHDTSLLRKKWITINNLKFFIRR